MRRTTSVAVLFTAGSLLTIAACASGSTSPPLPVVPGAVAWSRLTPAERAYRVDDYEHRVQDAIAACMKTMGFTYLPDYQADTASATVSDDSYEQRRTLRAKYGFFLFAPYAYPDDPAVKERIKEPAAASDPNAAAVAKLAPAEQKAYAKALDGDGAAGAVAPSATPSSPGCRSTAATAAGPDPRPKLTVAQQNQVRDHFHVSLAAALRSYSSCLKGKGFNVPDDPQAMLSTVYEAESSKLATLQKRGRIDAATAKAELGSEITAALTDIDCGQSWFRLHDQETRALRPDLG